MDIVEKKCDVDRCDATGRCSLDKCFYEEEEVDIGCIENELDSMLFQENMDWGFNKPEYGKYETIYIFERKEEAEEEELDKCGYTGGMIEDFDGCGDLIDPQDTSMLGNTSYCIKCYEKHETTYYDKNPIEE